MICELNEVFVLLSVLFKFKPLRWNPPRVKAITWKVSSLDFFYLRQGGNDWASEDRWARYRYKVSDILSVEARWWYRRS